MSKKNRHSRFSRAARVAVAASTGWSPASRRAADAAAELRRAETELRRAMQQHANVSVPFRAGRAAEIHHAGTFNAHAAVKGSAERAFTTSSMGQPTAAADVVISGGARMRNVQVKYHASPESTAAHLARPRYSAMQKVVPSDQLEGVTATASRRADALSARRPARATEMRDTANRASDRIRGETAESRPLSKQEAHELAGDPGRLGRAAFKTEAVGALKAGAVAGAGVSAVFSAYANVNAVLAGEKTKSEAAKAIVVDSVKGAAAGAGTAVAATAVKEVLMRGGMPSVARSVAPVAIVCTALEVGSAAAALGRGEIDGKGFAIRGVKAVGRTASGIAGAKIGAGVGAVIGGPVGAAIGGVLGGLAGALAFGKVADRK